jgi:hypothetical protein
MNKKETVNVVPAIEKILSGTALDQPTEKPITKVDGRSKEYKSTVKRVAEGGRKKDGEGLDARSKSFKDTFARISAKAEKKIENEPKEEDDAKEEPQVEEGWYEKGKKKKKKGNKKEMKEMFSDVDFLIDQLTNMMEHLDKSEFIDVVSTEVKGVSSKTAQKMFEDYWKLSSISDWKDWLMGYGIRESVNELQTQSSPKYRGGASVVRGGLAMTDERLGKLRIMMRNIAKFEGVDALANEICDALDRSDGMKLAQAIIKKKKSY